jgi:phosphatidylinositol glycan class N
LISLFSPYFHKVFQIDWRLIVRLIYFCLAIVIDIISTSKKIKFIIIEGLTWGLSLIALFPLPLLKTAKENNILLKILLRIMPFYILLTRSYESIFLIIFYNYLQLWINLKWRIKKANQKYNFNLIDLFMFLTLLYISAFMTGNVASISGFTISSVFRFISVYIPSLLTALIMIKLLLPSFFVTLALSEICKIYNYSIWDSLFMLVAFSQIMNIRFFFNIRDFGSWKDIGLSISYFIITNVITFVQFFMFLFVKFLDSIDIKINNLKGPRSRENLKNKRYNLVDIEGKILIRNNDKI